MAIHHASHRCPLDRSNTFKVFPGWIRTPNVTQRDIYKVCIAMAVDAGSAPHARIGYADWVEIVLFQMWRMRCAGTAGDWHFLYRDVCRELTIAAELRGREIPAMTPETVREPVNRIATLLIEQGLI